MLLLRLLAVLLLSISSSANAWYADALVNGERHLQANQQGMVQVGQDEPANIQVVAGISRQDTLSYSGATYIAAKFESFNLPPGDEVVVKSPDGSISYSYTGKGRNQAGSFYSSIIPGDKVVVQYNAQAALASVNASEASSFGYKIPAFARGFRSRASIQSVCGEDQSVPAKCYAPGTSLSSSLPLAYTRAQAVARLYINALWMCTGWLAGSEGHLMTNNHCINETSRANEVDVEFEGESSSCSDQCLIALGCSGTIAATTSTLIATNPALDYALVKLPASANVKKYGYLQLRESGPVVGESIYIAGHPKAFAKRISAVVDSGADASITGLNVPGCVANQVGYDADTESGSSGSPVLAKSDNTVVALHNCGGGCTNMAVDVRDVLADLKTKGVSVADLVYAEAPVTAAPPKPLPGQCPNRPAASCEDLYFCVWDYATQRCQRRKN